MSFCDGSGDTVDGWTLLGMQGMSADKVKAKDRFVWNTSVLCPPQIYVRINSIRKSGTQASADCWQGTKHWKRTFPLPLPVSMQRQDWTFEEIENGK